MNFTICSFLFFTFYLHSVCDMPVVLMELQRETYDIRDPASVDTVGAAAPKILSKADFAPTGFK